MPKSHKHLIDSTLQNMRIFLVFGAVSFPFSNTPSIFDPLSRYLHGISNCKKVIGKQAKPPGDDKKTGKPLHANQLPRIVGLFQHNLSVAYKVYTHWCRVYNSLSNICPHTTHQRST